jgi:hypothetical protein
MFLCMTLRRHVMIIIALFALHRKGHIFSAGLILPSPFSLLSCLIQQKPIIILRKLCYSNSKSDREAKIRLKKQEFVVNVRDFLYFKRFAALLVIILFLFVSPTIGGHN